MHNSRIRQACSSGTCLDGLADRLPLSVSPRELVLSYVLAVLAAFVLPSLCCPGDFRQRPRSERSGEARLRSKMSFGDEAKVILRNEQVAPRVGGVDVIAC